MSSRDSNGRFRPGSSGNYSGRKPGVPDRRSELRAALAGEAPALLQRAIALALSGDRETLCFLLGRLLPVARHDETVALPCAPDATLGERVRLLCQAAFDGSLSPASASSLARMLQAESGIIEVEELSARIAALELREKSFIA